MYIQLTTICNMTCDHCCMSATNKGIRMERHVFMQALQVAIQHGDHITLGGGEPTTHKEFFDFLDKAIEFFDCGSLELPPFVITNGKAKTKAHKLLDYVEAGRSVHVELSQDQWHDPIDYRVVQRFRAHQKDKERSRYSWGSGRDNDNASAGIRTVRSIVNVGRAKKNGIGEKTDGLGRELKCACEDIFCDPSGNLYSCGCQHTKLGTLWNADAVYGDYDHEHAHEGGRYPDEIEIGCESVMSEQPSSPVHEHPVFPILELSDQVSNRLPAQISHE